MAREQDEVLLRITARYVAEFQAGQQPRLSNYLARYPQYASAIADFVAYYHAFEVSVPAGMDTDTSLTDISREVLRRVQARIWQQPAQRVNLLPFANGRTLTLVELADSLNLSVDIVIQLEQRMIEPATIPYELYRRLAAALGQPVDIVQSYFREDDQARQETGSHAKPHLWVAEEQAYYPGVVKRQSFRQALKASRLIAAEQATDWQAILRHEKL